MCDTCENVLMIFKQLLPKCLIIIIHEFSHSGRYCVRHQQCSICKKLINFNAMRWFKYGKPLLCRIHRSYIDTRCDHIKSFDECWYDICYRESKYYLCRMEHRNNSRSDHQFEWYNQEHIIESAQGAYRFKLNMIRNYLKTKTKN
jgi:hypothetical protein